MADSARVVGRYEVLEEIAAGGMATIHLGRVLGEAVTAPTFIAVKRMHAQYARDPDFRSMFMDEARLCARITHENVVPTIDVVEADGELLLILELVEGESLAKLVRQVNIKKGRVPIRITSAIVIGLLQGLHAAHEAVSETGEALHMVHRDVSPHNVFVGTDGVTRVLDFGVAKARGRMQQTQHGQVKGKIAYMSPEQARGKAVDRRSDVFAAGIVLWELLTGKRLFDRDNEAAVLAQLLTETPAYPSERDPSLKPYDALVKKALEVEPAARFESALKMAAELAREISPATKTEVAAWVHTHAEAALRKRAELIARHVQVASRSELDDTPRKDLDEPSSVDGSAPMGPLPPPSAPSRPRLAAPITPAPPLEPTLPPEAFLTQRIQPLHSPDNDPLPPFRPPPPSSAPLVGPPPSPEPSSSSDLAGGRASFADSGLSRVDPVTGESYSGQSGVLGIRSDGPPTQSQVTSVSLTTSGRPPPPPLPPERVRQLFWVGMVTAGSVAAVVVSLLVIVAKRSHGAHPETGNHHSIAAATGLSHTVSSLHLHLASAPSAPVPVAPPKPDDTPTPSASIPVAAPPAPSFVSPRPAPQPTQAWTTWPAPPPKPSSTPGKSLAPSSSKPSKTH